jgi:hypothetical protein
MGKRTIDADANANDNRKLISDSLTFLDRMGFHLVLVL